MIALVAVSTSVVDEIAAMTRGVLFMNREHVDVWFDLSGSLSSTRFLLVSPPLQPQGRLGPTSLSRRHRELVHPATHAQKSWATDLLSVPRERTFLVLSRVGCVQVLLDTNSCCAYTKQFDQAFRRSVVDEQESDLVPSSFRSNVVQIALILLECAKCTQVRPIPIRRVFDIGFDQAPRCGDAHVFANRRSLRLF